MGLTAQAFTLAVWIRALQTLSGGGKKQVEHLAFEDAGAPQPQGQCSHRELGTTGVRWDERLPTDVTASSSPSAAGHNV